MSCFNGICRYFGAAKDLPGVRELFQQERKIFIYGEFHSMLCPLACCLSVTSFSIYFWQYWLCPHIESQVYLMYCVFAWEFACCSSAETSQKNPRWADEGRRCRLLWLSRWRRLYFGSAGKGIQSNLSFWCAKTQWTTKMYICGIKTKHNARCICVRETMSANFVPISSLEVWRVLDSDEVLLFISDVVSPLADNFRHCFMCIMYLKAAEKKAIAAKVEEYRAKKEAALAGGGGDVMDVEETDIYQVEVWQSAASYSHLLWWLNNFFKMMQCEVI